MKAGWYPVGLKEMREERVSDYAEIRHANAWFPDRTAKTAISRRRAMRCFSGRGAFRGGGCAPSEEVWLGEIWYNAR